VPQAGMERDDEGYLCWTTTWNEHNGNVGVIVNAVRAAGDDVDHFDDYELTLLFIACLRGTPDDVAAVLSAGASPVLPILCDGQLGPCPVLYVFNALEKDTVLPKLRLLVAAGAPLDVTDDAQTTVWKNAESLAEPARHEVVQWLGEQALFRDLDGFDGPRVPDGPSDFFE
jgi:hypothetical protein